MDEDFVRHTIRDGDVVVHRTESFMGIAVAVHVPGTLTWSVRDVMSATKIISSGMSSDDINSAYRVNREAPDIISITPIVPDSSKAVMKDTKEIENRVLLGLMPEGQEMSLLLHTAGDNKSGTFFTTLFAAWRDAGADTTEWPEWLMDKIAPEPVANDFTVNMLDEIITDHITFGASDVSRPVKCYRAFSKAVEEQGWGDRSIFDMYELHGVSAPLTGVVMSGHLRVGDETSISSSSLVPPPPPPPPFLTIREDFEEESVPTIVVDDPIYIQALPERKRWSRRSKK